MEDYSISLWLCFSGFLRCRTWAHYSLGWVCRHSDSEEMVGDKIGRYPPRDEIPWWLIAVVMGVTLITLVMVYT